MTFRRLLNERIGRGEGQFRKVEDMADHLGVSRDAVYNWKQGKSEPKGKLRQMLDIAERLGYTRDEAMRIIDEDDDEPTPGPTPEQVLADVAHMPPNVVARFLPGGDLEAGDPAAWAAVWAAAMPMIEMLAKQQTGKS
jgi:transcriptional regulator with XRE-family HTH domain